MYANMEAGLMYGEAITGLDDVNEMSRLSENIKTMLIILLLELLRFISN